METIRERNSRTEDRSDINNIEAKNKIKISSPSSPLAALSKEIEEEIVDENHKEHQVGLIMFILKAQSRLIIATNIIYKNNFIQRANRMPRLHACSELLKEQAGHNRNNKYQL